MVFWMMRPSLACTSLLLLDGSGDTLAELGRKVAALNMK